MPPIGPVIQDLDTPTAPDSQLAHLLDLEQAWLQEYRPGDPPRPRSESVARLRCGPPHGAVCGRALAWLGDGAVGFGYWEISVIDNPQSTWLSVFVAPDARRRGIGSALLGHLLDRVSREGAMEADFGLSEHVPSALDMRAVVEGHWGLPTVYTERVARLDLRSVDRRRVREDLGERLERLADRVRLLDFAMDDLPDPATGFRLADYVSMVQRVWRLMPLEDLRLNDEVYSVGTFRDQVGRQRAQGRIIWNDVALDAGSGTCIGVTNVSYNPRDPRRVDQWDTGVLREHQGHGLGTVLKLRMLLRILQQLPEAWFIETENAASNAAMIHINDALGFREVFRERVYQVSIARLRALLGADHAETTAPR